MRNIAEGADIEKVWKLRETAVALTLDKGQCDTLLRTPSTVMPGKGVIYWNLQWDVLPEWVNCFKPLSERKLLSVH